MQRCHVIGGGVIGLSLAWELSSHGVRVCVVEQHAQPGREASWAGAGILPPANPLTAVHAWDRLRGLSSVLHPEWAAALRRETGIDTGFRRCGGIYLARTAGEAALLHGISRSFREEGIAIERVDAARLREIEPGLTSAVERGAIRVAYLVPNEAQLRNPHHLRALATACARRGVEFALDVHVQGFEVAGDRLQRLKTSRGEIPVDTVCVTSGAWTSRLLGQLGWDAGIAPIRGQLVLYRCDRPPLRRIVNEGPRYLVPREDGRVLAGSSEEDAGFDKRTTAEVLAELRRMASELVGELQDTAVEAAWAGLRPGSLDGLPLLGRVPGLVNAFVAAGHFRSGLQTSPGTAVAMSCLIRGEPAPIDLTPFRVGRMG